MTDKDAVKQRRDPMPNARCTRMTAAVLVLGLVCVGVWALRLWLTRPLASADEIEATGELALDAIRDAQTRSCPRPVLRGEAIAGDASADLVRLLSVDSPFAACLSFVGEHRTEVEDAIWLSDGRIEPLPEDTTRTEVEDDPPSPDASSEWDYPRKARRLHAEPLAVEREVLTRCAGLDLEVDRIVQHASVCTPFPFGSGDPDIRVLWLMKALVIVARDRLQHGESRRGFELLLDAEQFALDAQRGRPQLVGAMIGVAAMRLIHAQVQWLLLNELPWTEADLVALTHQASLLSAQVNRPDRWAADDLLAVTFPVLSQLGVGIPEEAIVVPSTLSDEAAIGLIAFTMHTYPNIARLCEGLGTNQECAARYGAEAARVAALEDSVVLPFAYAFPNLAPDEFQSTEFASWHRSMVPLLNRAWRAEAERDALPLLFVARRLALDGQCPTAEELTREAGTLLTPTGLGGALEVLSSNVEFEPLEVCAPGWMAPVDLGRVRLPLLDAYCPAFPLVDTAEARD